MSADPLAILQVSAATQGGGAERVALALHEGLRGRGHASWLAVARRDTDDPDVLLVPAARPGRLEAAARHAGALALAPLAGRVEGAARAQRALNSQLTLRQRLDWWRGRESFAFPGTAGIPRLTQRRPDVIHCHNLHGGWFDLRRLAFFDEVAPVALTLHDEWAYTGHCAYTLGCERWRETCGSCPDLSIYPALRRDATAANRRAKRAVYRRSRLHVSAPSGWLLDRARDSILAEGAVSWRAIPNGVDRATFAPGERRAARRRLGLPEEAAIVLFAANAARTNPFKDLATVVAAARRAALEHPSRPLLCLVLGDDGPTQRHGNAEIRHVPYEADAERVADHHRAADLYLHAALADTFPVTVLEALACGVPTVATAVGGIPEQVRSLRGAPGAWDGPGHAADRATGVLVPRADPEAMGTAAAALLADEELRASLGVNAAADAAARFDLERQLDATIEWYRDVLADRGRAPKALPR